MTNEARLAKSHSNSAAARAACFKVLRSKENRKIITQICEGNDTAMLHAIVGVWKEYLHETRYETAKKEKGRQHHEKGHNVVDKALIVWGRDKKVLLLYEVMKVWNECIAEERETESKTTQSAEQQRIKKQHHQKIDYVLLRMKEGNSEFLKQHSCAAWKNFVKETKHGAGNSEIKRQEAMHREIHKHGLAQGQMKNKKETNPKYKLGPRRSTKRYKRTTPRQGRHQYPR